MKRRVYLSFLIIALVAAAITGGTMAWFTAEEELENLFTAGTLFFDAREVITSEHAYDHENVNPGDCFEKEFEIDNSGTKHMLMRMKLTELWKFDDAHLIANWEHLGLDDVHVGDPAAEIATWTTNLDVDDFGELAILTNPVTWPDIATDLEAADWIWDAGTEWWYYNGVLPPDTLNVLDYSFSVCFDGPDMGNEFQGVEYKLIVTLEAIQASHDASGASGWLESVYDPFDGGEKAEDWNNWLGYPSP